MCRSSRRGPATLTVFTTSAPARAAWPMSMHTPMRGSRLPIFARTSDGAGHQGSSVPWLWMAALMSNSLTIFSRRSRVSGAGEQTTSGIPAAFAYSKSLRMAASSGVFQVSVPPPMIVRPAASNCWRAARIWSGVSVRARWTSLIVTYLTPSSWRAAMALSRGNLRSEYEATPIFSGRGFGPAAACIAAADGSGVGAREGHQGQRHGGAGHVEHRPTGQRSRGHGAISLGRGLVQQYPTEQSGS